MTAGQVVTPQVEVVTRGPVSELLIGRGAKRNALTGAGWSELAERVAELGRGEDVRAVVIRGRDGGFCAGSDITEWTDAELDAVEDSFARMESAFRAVEECPVPVLAEVRGIAAGAGCQLALACDLRFMGEAARIGMPIARLGIMCSPAFAARMVALVGPSSTRRLLYTGSLLDAPAAAAGGLVDEHLPEAELADHVTAVAGSIANQPRSAVVAAKRAVNAALAPAREATRWNGNPAVSAADFRTGITTFLHRSRPAAEQPT
ncbi:enoyl-CoA hydratase/isomerase family protein [Saccharopolyspora griseoalba]|uniref:Enoyl-CoA hydratase/isomerase family protein n=1 Tax=Saccharopolyspora griseoalba TaxID=1431848 RepID=A0ABW2LU77_9PSEU